MPGSTARDPIQTFEHRSAPQVHAGRADVHHRGAVGDQDGSPEGTGRLAAVGAPPALPDNLDPMSSRCISANLAGDAALDDDFAIPPIGGLWAVVSSEIILAWCWTVPDVIRAAVQVASHSAGYVPDCPNADQ